MLSLLILAACTKQPAPEPVDTDTTPTGTTDTDTDTTPTGTDDTALTVPHTGDTGATTTLDCGTLPALPVTYDTLQDWGTAEDFDFDGNGYHVAVLNGNLYAKDRYGDSQVISPGIGSFTSGTRLLSTGDWIVADSGSNALIRIDTANGAQTVVLGGLNYPNGVEVDRKGYAFVAENGASRVRQVDPYTLETWPVAMGVDQSNGLILSPDEMTLYVGSFGAGKVWKVPRLTDTTWGPPEVLWETTYSADGGFDGINVDVCGNVYITEYIKGKVWRITPDGLHGDLVVDLPSSWIPNMRWGTGVGGWATDILYVADRDQGRLFALHMGIEGKKHVLAP